jgi:hypothetical protein
MDWSRLHGGEAVQVRESGEGANERQERVPERVSVFILPDGHGLGCTSVGRDWAPWVALWAASCTESRGTNSSVGGWLAWQLRERIQT